MNTLLLKLSLLVILVMCPTSCVYDEIVISMTMHDTIPEFHFMYLASSDKTVWLTDVAIYEADTGKMVWMMSSLEPSLFQPANDSKIKRIPKNAETSLGEIRGVQMANLTFGVVPEGFIQYYPEGKPILVHNVEYILGVAAATSGRILFTVDGKCRRLSSTSRSKDHPLFKGNADCLLLEQ